MAMSTNPPGPDGGGQAVVLAGGLATRMLPRTERVPKILLPVAGRPFVDRLLERLVACGLRDVVLCTGHLGDLVRAHVGDGSTFGARARFSDEGDLRLGTAGALRLALPLLRPTFVVTYGDSFLPFDYAAPLRDLAAHPDALGALAVYRNDDHLGPSNAVVSGGRVVRYQKRAAGEPRGADMDHIDYGATALRREVIERLVPGERLDLGAVQSHLADLGRLRAFEAAARFFEIGSEAGLRDLEAHLASPDAPDSAAPPRAPERP